MTNFVQFNQADAAKRVSQYFEKKSGQPRTHKQKYTYTKTEQVSSRLVVRTLVFVQFHLTEVHV